MNNGYKKKNTVLSILITSYGGYLISLLELLPLLKIFKCQFFILYQNIGLTLIHTNSFLDMSQTVTLPGYNRCAELVTACNLYRIRTVTKSHQISPNRVQNYCTFSIKKIDFFFYCTYIIDEYNIIVLMKKEFNEK